MEMNGTETKLRDFITLFNYYHVNRFTNCLYNRFTQPNSKVGRLSFVVTTSSFAIRLISFGTLKLR